MSETEISAYRMNPAEDRICFGDELAEGMWVLAEDATLRRPHGQSEDEKLRAQRFHRVTRLYLSGNLVRYVAEWIDGYQEVISYSVDHAWLVKKDAITAGDENFGIDGDVTEG